MEEMRSPRPKRAESGATRVESSRYWSLRTRRRPEVSKRGSELLLLEEEEEEEEEEVRVTLMLRFRSTDARSIGGEEEEEEVFPSSSSSSSSSLPPPVPPPPPPALSSSRLGGTSHLPRSSASASLTLRTPPPGRPPPSSTATLTRAKSGPSSGWTPLTSFATPTSVEGGLRGPPARPEKAAADEEASSFPSLVLILCSFPPFSSSNAGSAALAWKQAGSDSVGPACVSASMGGRDSSKCSRRGDQQQPLRSQALRSMPT